MKRNLLAVGVFSACCLALFAGETQAWFGLLSPYHPSSLWHRHNRYVTHITCRPYNAFTPICWGNLICDGCCPNPCGVASGCLPMTMGVPPWACGPSCGMPCFGGACGGAAVSDMPPIRHYPAPTPSFTPPAPMPVGPQNTMMYPYNGVAQANYPMYMPYYVPAYYNPYMGYPTMQPMPNYWYGYGR